MPEYILYAGGYAKADEPGIHAFDFNDENGQIVPRGSFAGFINPSYILPHPTGPWLYAVSETSEQQDGVTGGLLALRVEDGGQSFQAINNLPSGGDFPCHLTIDATGRWLLVANYGSGTVGLFSIGEDGALREMTDLVHHHGSGPNKERQEGPHTHSTIVSHDNRFVIVADLGTDSLVVYNLDAQAGKLHKHGEAHTHPGAGPRHMVFHPSGKYLYVANELGNTVAVFSYDSASGDLEGRQAESTIGPAAPETTTAHIHLSPDGRHLYVSNRGDNSIAVFEVASDASLTQTAIIPCGGNWPRNFAVSPGGGFLVVANQYSNDLAVVPVSGDLQAPHDPVAKTTVQAASCVKFAP